jgi:RecA-family ATPase
MDITKLKEDEEEDEIPRFIVRDATFALSPQPPVEWIIEQLISSISVSMFYGEPGSKKTFALLSLAVCVALGKEWLGFKTNPRKVLIIDEESGEFWLTRRLSAAIRGELGDENIPVEFVSMAAFKVDNKKDAAELQELIIERQAKLVIIDALADVMDGDENSKQDCQPVFTALKRIAIKTGCAIIIIHHSNKSGGYRGSSAIKGALDLQVKIESEDGSHWINFKSEKTRNIEAIKFYGKATWTEDQFYLTQADKPNQAKRQTPSQEFVIRYLKEHRASSKENIMYAADVCSPEAARKAIYALVEAGIVYRTNPNERGRGVDAVFDLVKKDEPEAENEYMPG